MFDAYQFIKVEIAAALSPMHNAAPADIRICERGYEASMALRPGVDAGPSAPELSTIKSPYIRGITKGNGSLCFSLSKAFYDEAVERINASKLVRAPEDSERFEDAALLRLMMLARKGGQGCPDDAELMRLMWLAFGIAGFCSAGEHRRLHQRVRTVSQLAIKLGAGRSIADRDALYGSMGAAAGATARLLALGMSFQEV